MKSYGPTSLIKIKDNHLLDLQISAIKKAFSQYEIVLCVGFDADKITKYIRAKYSKLNIRIVENQMFNSCNSCEGARLSINNTLNDKILFMDGNLLISHKALLCVDTSKNCVLMEKNPIENLEIGINIDDENKAQYFSFGAYQTWSEVFFVNGYESIEDMRKFLSHNDSKKKFVFEAINDLLKKHDIHCIENTHQIHKINNIKTYHHIKENHEILNF
jgi:NDP-sugar pyrophosphorylase family protein